jgi:hypothetical protein
MTPPPYESDEALGARLRAELPRHAAPAHVRAVVAQASAPTTRATPWLSPLLAAAATALVLVLVFMPLLPRFVHPTEQLVRSVVAEHMRTLMWGSRHSQVIPAALPWLTQESGIGLKQVFAGDEILVFLGAEPVYLVDRRGMALYYRDNDGHLLTYIVLPYPGMPILDRWRVPIERGQSRYRPALLHEEGFSTWVWRQGDLACFLVSDMVSTEDAERFKDYFVRVRRATDPVPAQ